MEPRWRPGVRLGVANCSGEHCVFDVGLNFQVTTRTVRRLAPGERDLELGLGVMGGPYGDAPSAGGAAGVHLLGAEGEQAPAERHCQSAGSTCAGMTSTSTASPRGVPCAQLQLLASRRGNTAKSAATAWRASWSRWARAGGGWLSSAFGVNTPGHPATATRAWTSSRTRQQHRPSVGSAEGERQRMERRPGAPHLMAAGRPRPGSLRRAVRCGQESAMAPTVGRRRRPGCRAGGGR